jgi:hypothetical protein
MIRASDSRAAPHEAWANKLQDHAAADALGAELVGNKAGNRA